jgi:hypothetical protein
VDSSIAATAEIVSSNSRVNAYGWKALAGSVIGYAMDGSNGKGRVDLEMSKKFWKFASPVVLNVAHGFSSHAHQDRVLP